MIRFLPQELLCLYLMRNFCLSSYFLLIVFWGHWYNCLPFRVPSGPGIPGPKSLMSLTSTAAWQAEGGAGAGAAGRWGEPEKWAGIRKGLWYPSFRGRGPGYGVGDWGPRFRPQSPGSGFRVWDRGQGTRSSPARPAPCSPRGRRPPHRPWLVRERQAGEDRPTGSSSGVNRTDPGWRADRRAGGHFRVAPISGCGRSRERMGCPAGGGVTVVTARA